MADDKGDESCLISIANMLFKGDGIDMNKEEACKYYKLLADNGNVSCAAYLANMLYNGNGVPENKSEAAEYFKLAADLGDDDSMYTFALALKRIAI
ncbi:hypothetical protein M9Y10_033451 [Tritrichomonas musculus]|uniref:Uncharacterized protein n=1 Tax=Tritrichomonas musculus TaxID=1915356 RepID=A0ABR2KCV4_9EUKA